MKRYLLLGALVAFLLGPNPVQAQKIIEKKAPLSNGQRLVLELPYAAAIRIKGGSGKEVFVKATVNINNNTLNDALLLTLNTAREEVKIQAAFDEEVLRKSPHNNSPNGEGSTTLIHNSDKYTGDSYRLNTRVDYEIEVPAGAWVTVETFSGNITVTGLDGPLQAKSFGGFVDVSWPPTKGAEVFLASTNGMVYTNQDIVFNNRKDDSPPSSPVRGKLGSSGPPVRLESYSSDVFFRKQN